MGLLFLLLAQCTLAQAAPPPITQAGQMPPKGPSEVKEAEYRYERRVDPLVLDDRETEIWGQLYRPAHVGENQRMPVVVMLHGNHYTCGLPHPDGYREDDSCEYSYSGTCSDGRVVVPNHLGYGYIARNLASWGYLVISINANLGINCSWGADGDWGLNLARGRLILRHLHFLSLWNRGLKETPHSIGVSLRGKLDLSHVGMFGHSRGGEGVRAAYNLYRDRNSIWPRVIPDRLGFDGIIEVGAVDGQTDRVLDALDVAWSQILPACDSDVYFLDGVRPYDRMMDKGHQEARPTLKSTLYVWGANHNHFNTEWHQSESNGCTGHEPIFQAYPPTVKGSPGQQKIAANAVRSMILGNVGTAPASKLNRFFDPAYKLPASVTPITRIERGYLSTPHAKINPILENFSGEVGKNMYGHDNKHSGVEVEHGTLAFYYSDIRAASITWSRASPQTFFQTNWAQEGRGIDLSRHPVLSFRIARRPFSMSEKVADLGLSLVDANGNLSRELRLRDYVQVLEPVGNDFGAIHPILQTAKIGTEDFSGIDLRFVRGLRLTFNGSAAGTLYLDEVRTEYRRPRTLASFVEREFSLHPDPRTPRLLRARIESRMERGAALGAEWTIRADEPFPVGGALLTLEGGGEVSKLSGFPDPKDLRRVTFRMKAGQAERMGKAEHLRIKQGNSGKIWGVEK